MENNIEKKILSIIVPVYNVEDYIEKCLYSLVNQNIENYEIIVVVDGSKDDSIITVNKYKKKYPNLIVVKETENRGLSAARNLGISLAKGKYIGFVDSDDYVDHSMFSKMLKSAIKNNSDIVVCSYYKNINKVLKKVNIKKMISTNDFLLHCPPYAWNKIYRADLFENIRFPEKINYEDISTVFPLICLAQQINVINEPLYYYTYKRDGSILSTYTIKTLDLIKSLEILNDFFKKNDIFNKYNEELCFLNIKHLFQRFYDFKNYKCINLKFKIIKESFKHLNCNFKTWNENKYFDNRIFFIKYKLYWHLRILMPRYINKFRRSQ